MTDIINPCCVCGSTKKNFNPDYCSNKCYNIDKYSHTKDEEKDRE